MQLRGTRWPVGVFCSGTQERRGFTLIEMLIVGALIALFSGLAIIGAQRLWEDSKRKGIFDETKSVGTALSFAHDDVAFFPRINLLTDPRNLIMATAGNTTIIRPAVDAYGFLGENTALTGDVIEKWQGSYMGMAESRLRMSQGAKGMVTMRLPETSQFPGAWSAKGIDVSLTYWPCDAWGNPYVVYLVVSDATVANSNNKLGLRLISRPNESSNYFTAVVSYGPNHVPGGVPPEFYTDNNPSPAAIARAKAWVETMKSARLYIINNDNSQPVTRTDAGAAFTMRSVTSAIAVASFNNAQFLNALPNSITNQTTPGDVAQPGIKDPGSDDIVWTF
jgi:prepilin-type N-terminal cleavage/methylation domain-containing protein